MKRSRATRRRVAGNANHAIRKHATAVGRISALSRATSLKRRITRDFTGIRAYKKKRNRFYEGQAKQSDLF